MIRRTISLKDGLFKKIQEFRGKLISSNVVEDINFTSATNFLLIGGLIMAKNFNDAQMKELIEIFSDHELEESAILDKKVDDILRSAIKSVLTLRK